MVEKFHTVLIIISLIITIIKSSLDIVKHISDFRKKNKN